MGAQLVKPFHQLKQKKTSLLELFTHTSTLDISKNANAAYQDHVKDIKPDNEQSKILKEIFEARKSKASLTLKVDAWIDENIHYLWVPPDVMKEDEWKDLDMNVKTVPDIEAPESNLQEHTKSRRSSEGSMRDGGSKDIAKDKKLHDSKYQVRTLKTPLSEEDLKSRKKDGDADLYGEDRMDKEYGVDKFHHSDFEMDDRKVDEEISSKPKSTGKEEVSIRSEKSKISSEKSKASSDRFKISSDRSKMSSDKSKMSSEKSKKSSEKSKKSSERFVVPRGDDCSKCNQTGFSGYTRPKYVTIDDDKLFNCTACGRWTVQAAEDNGEGGCAKLALYPYCFSFFTYFYSDEVDDNLMPFRRHIASQASKNIEDKESQVLFKNIVRDAFLDRRILSIERKSLTRIFICKLKKKNMIKGLPRRRIIILSSNVDQLMRALSLMEDSLPEVMEGALFHRPFPVSSSRRWVTPKGVCVRKYNTPMSRVRRKTGTERLWHKRVMLHRTVPPTFIDPVNQTSQSNFSQYSRLAKQIKSKIFEHYGNPESKNMDNYLLNQKENETACHNRIGSRDSSNNGSDTIDATMITQPRRIFTPKQNVITEFKNKFNIFSSPHKLSVSGDKRILKSLVTNIKNERDLEGAPGQLSCSNMNHQPRLAHTSSNQMLDKLDDKYSNYTNGIDNNLPIVSSSNFFQRNENMLENRFFSHSRRLKFPESQLTHLLFRLNDKGQPTSICLKNLLQQFNCMVDNIQQCAEDNQTPSVKVHFKYNKFSDLKAICEMIGYHF